MKADGAVSEMRNTENGIEKLKRFIDESDSVIFFGGAGVSTESGVPDFRSKNGLYNKPDVNFEKYRPEYLLSHTCLVSEPEVFFEFYRQKLDTRNVEPNAAHYALAELERRGKLKGVVTQNIDGLHQKAGSKRVFEIHGTTSRNYCMKCGKAYPSDYIFKVTGVPKCSCGGTVRCDVTLYEESLPEDAVRGAVDAISSADMLIIGGTSLTVYPAASYIGFFRGRYLAVINLEHVDHGISLGEDRFVEINAPIGKVLGQVV